MMKIIGIDPGLAATGIGVVIGEECKVFHYAFGSIYTSETAALPDRLNRIYSKLSLILQEETPDLMVVEDIFSMNKYPKSGITLGKVTGVILLAGFQAKIPVIEISVREVKQILTGNGNASKNQLEKCVRHQLNMHTPIRPSHASDATGLALIGLFRYQNLMMAL